MKLIREYYGYTIYRNIDRPTALRWYTVAPSFAADTLQGIKDLIREYEKGV